MMNAGKIAAQAGHAYLDSYLNCLDQDPQRAKEYKQHHGIKVCLQAKNLSILLKADALAKELNIPHQLVVDLGYTQFEGQDTITALGIGPARQDEIKLITKKLQLLTYELNYK